MALALGAVHACTKDKKMAGPACNWFVYVGSEFTKGNKFQLLSLRRTQTPEGNQSATY
jgi:hypothetical protein